MCKWLTSSVIALLGVSLAGAGMAGTLARVASAPRDTGQQLAAVELGKAISPLSALEQAAGRGELDAQFNLARIHAAGEGVPRSPLQAFKLYQHIVDSYADVHPREPRARRVARAFVALGDYYRSGIQGSAIKADKGRAVSLYRHAASYLGDADAQYKLAQMYLRGEGVARNGRLAVNWLTNASKKRHANSQALLGDLLWRGARDVRRQPLKGLALLTIAGQNAKDEAQARWIEGLRVSALEQAQDHERAGAERLAARWQSRIGQPPARENPAAAKPQQPVADEAGAAISRSGVKGFTTIGLDAAVTR